MSDDKDTAKQVAGNDATRRTAKEAAGGDENALLPISQHPRTQHEYTWVTACKKGYERHVPKFRPICFDADGLFQTAEDVHHLLDLDAVPDTIEAYTVPYSAEEQPVLIKYCFVPLSNYLALCEAANFIYDPITILIDGRERTIRTPTALKDRRKLRKGKLPVPSYLR
ncbi:hypothetical protein F503_06539 [Ophiostoma piceae UAMH 11346]|uniref:Uncharacterized protein n=1 Tax=Ophiostoma piceae (strain UAMH 11346) TaxID=1262450 RepID=S3BM95_OPHP1|nr:hypothetical protein F503_06539 [Ophiostoma piceae UAMH 11346]